MNIFDIVIVGIALLIVFLASKKGFVASCLDTLSVAISSIVSYKLCTVISDSVYNFVVKDLVKTEFKQALDDLSSAATLDEKLTAMVQSLPETARKLASSMGFNLNKLPSSSFTNQMDNETLVEQMASSLAYDIMIKFVEVIVFAVLFVLVAIIIRFLSNFFSKNLQKLPFIGKADTFFGAIFGLVQAAIIVLAGSVILYIAVETADPGSPLEQIEASKIYLFMLENNPIIQIFTGGNT